MQLNAMEEPTTALFNPTRHTLPSSLAPVESTAAQARLVYHPSLRHQSGHYPPVADLCTREENPNGIDQLSAETVNSSRLLLLNQENRSMWRSGRRIDSSINFVVFSKSFHRFLVGL